MPVNSFLMDEIKKEKKKAYVGQMFNTTIVSILFFS